MDVEQSAEKALQCWSRPKTAHSWRLKDAIDALADAAIGTAGDPIAPAARQAAVREATDPDDLMQRLGRLAANMPAVEFAELTERALFAADVLGYMHDYEHGARKP